MRSRHPFLNLKRTIAGFALASVLLSANSHAARKHQQASASASASAPIQFATLPLQRSAQNHLLVTAFINGKRAVLGVDSGAPVSAIAMHRRAYFGLTAATAGGEIPTKLSINGQFNNVVMAKSLTLGSLNLVDEPLVAVDLRSIHKGRSRGTKDVELDGILGADVLIPTKALLDCERQMLVLNMEPETPGRAPGFDFRGFNRVPMHVSSGYNLYVDGAINGRAAKLMVDTGAFATLLHSRFVRSMKIPTSETPFSSSGVNLGERGVRIATISKFSVGSVDLQRKQVGVINLEGLITTPLLEGTPPVAGLLGSETLRSHHGIIDFGTNTLYLKR